MPDYRQRLASMYLPDYRYSNFGPAIRSITINGFRGISGLDVPFDYPVMAVSGLNGSGKSTVGQLCLSGYKKPSTSTGYKRFYVRDFFPASVADPSPFHHNSSVLFRYETDSPTEPQELTVSRGNSEWSGYKRQPERKCFYVGFTIYIPKVERKDVSIYRSTSISLTEQRAISDDTKIKVGRILGQRYDGLHFQGIRHGAKTGELGIAVRFGCQYSENNMGFGEGRTLYMVDLLENSPVQSLFVIEEPETSLHEHAQYELAKYLLDVCFRRRHQIVLSTHSDHILRALPSDARLLIHRDEQGVAVYQGLSSTRARAMLSLGEERALTVFVEDDFAEHLLKEMIRRVDVSLLNAVHIEGVGDTKAVRNAVLLMTRISKPAMAVRDADIGPDVANRIFSFPGSMPPERDVFQNTAVKEHLRTQFGLNVDNVLEMAGEDDHHCWAEILATAASTPEDHLKIVAIGSYLDDLGMHACEPLVEEIRSRA